MNRDDADTCPLRDAEGHDPCACDLCQDTYSVAMPLSRDTISHLDDSFDSDGGLTTGNDDDIEDEVNQVIIRLWIRDIAMS